MKKMEGEGEISSRACPRCCERDEIESRKNMEGEGENLVTKCEMKTCKLKLGLALGLRLWAATNALTIK